MVCKQALMQSCVDVPCVWLKALLLLSWSVYSFLKQLQLSAFTGYTYRLYIWYCAYSKYLRMYIYVCMHITQ